MESNFDFTLEPGRDLNVKNYNKGETMISVIIPFYNAGEFVEQTVVSVLNQTYPFYEIVIVDDGSKDKDSLKELERVAKLDKRIRVVHKENGGLASARDYGASKACTSSKYFFFLDADDVIEPTYLECAFWTMETHPDAAWAYANTVGFGTYTYLWEKWFDSNKMKKVNELVATALIRRECFEAVNGYELRVKAVNEDWNFWLKMLSKGFYPIHMNFFGFWYRRKETDSELKRVQKNKTVNSEIIKNSAEKVITDVYAIQYPKYTYNHEELVEFNNSIEVPTSDDNKKINILFIIPWMVMGGADVFNVEFLKRLDKEKYNITIINTLPNYNIFRQKFDHIGPVYDLTTFLDQKDWLSFINYIIKKENINFILNSNSECGYNMLPYLKATYPNIPIMDYIHMEEWYYKNGGFSRMSTADDSVIDKTLVCNKNSEKILVDYFKRNPKEINTVYIGVDSDRFDPEKQDLTKLKKKYGLEQNKRYVISYICRIANQKRPLLLAEIIRKTVEKRKDVLFLIAGNGEMLPKLRRAINKYSLSDNVKFVGPVKNTEEIYKVSDMTINCSIKEGLALTAYESLSMGIPVITSDVGGQKELINDKTGVVVPCLQKEEDINDYNYTNEEINNYVVAIEKVIKNLDDYKSNCRKRILNEFTLEKMGVNMTKEINEVYNNPLESKIANGKALAPFKNLLIQNIRNYFADSAPDYYYCIDNYHNKAFRAKRHDGDSKYVRYEMFKDAMWKNPLWRVFVKSPIWKAGKKVLKRGK